MPTIPQLFLDRVRRDPDGIAVWARTPPEADQFFLKEATTKQMDGPEGWTPATYTDIHRQVAGLARRLFAFGVSRGVPVAILANTSERWSAVDLAIQCLGGITVGIYPSLLPEQIRHQVEHSGAALLIVENEAQAERCLPFTNELMDLQHVLSLHPSLQIPQLTPALPDTEWLNEQVQNVRLEDIATYIYTSGTTGDAKAVVLNHHNFTSVIEASRTRLPLLPGDQTIIFLPMAHVLQRFTQYRGLADEAVGWFAPSINDLPATIAVARPHVMPAVPRMLEKIRNQIEAEAANKGEQASQILSWAIQVGQTVQEMKRRGARVGWRLVAQQKLADRLVINKVKAGLGGNLRLLICGGATLNPELAKWFEALGIAVREGWGLSETTAPAAVNGLEDVRFGTVGKALDGTEIVLAADGEIMVRGPGVFQGYLNDPVATDDAFTEEGFFKTGDLGHIEDGFIRIIGRKKEIIVTSGGKNIAPRPIEVALETGLIQAAMVVGDNRPYLTALLTPNMTKLTHKASRANWGETLEQWCSHPEFLQEIDDQVKMTNEALAQFQSIKKWVVLPCEFSEENGLLTPTLKPKRTAIVDRFHREIEGMYT